MDSYGSAKGYALTLRRSRLPPDHKRTQTLGGLKNLEE